MDREFLQRIDAHMERGNRLVDEISDEVRLTREEVRLSREERERSRVDAAEHARQAADHARQAAGHAELYSDTREFIREMTLRIERGTRELVREIRQDAASRRAQADAQTQLLLDSRDETRAQTRALLRVLDRLDGIAPQAGTARA